MNKNSHTADALREILATCADPLNRACEEYAKLERELAEEKDELRLVAGQRDWANKQLLARSETRRMEPPSAAEISAYRDLFRAELDKRMDTKHPSASPSTESHAVALRQFVANRNKQPVAATPCVVSEDSDELRGENAVLRDRIAELDAELARIRAAFGVATNDAVIVKAHELEEGPLASAPCVARRAVEEIKAIIQKHVPLPGWAYEDEIVRVVRECERSGA